MKRNIKRIGILLCMMVGLLSLSACGKADTSDSSVAVDKEITGAVKETVSSFLAEVCTMAPADITAQLAIYQEYEDAGQAVPSAYPETLEGWGSVLEELGAFRMIKEDASWSIEAIPGGYSAVVNAVFEKRDAEISVGFNKDLSMLAQAFQFSPVYTTREKLGGATINTAIGMGTVFLVLMFVSCLIACFKYIHIWEERNAGTLKTVSTAPSPAPAVELIQEEDLTDDLELAAVITAAIAASMNTSADGLVVRSIRRSSAAKWKRA